MFCHGVFLNHKTQTKIVITGVAGLVGKYLLAELVLQGYGNIVGIDKNQRKIAKLKKLYPQVKLLALDLSQNAPALSQYCHQADALFILHAQIGGCQSSVFERHTILSTQNLLQAFKDRHPSFVLFLSSSAIFSKIPTPYSEAKKIQEQLVLEAFPKACVLRPTILMGPNDDKHFSFLYKLGSLFHFLPIPGDGLYVRQPIYVGDLCRAMMVCYKEKRQAIYDLTGPQALPFKKLLEIIFKQRRSRVWLLNIPHGVFSLFFRLWSLLFPGFIFTHAQLKTLILDERFTGVDWKLTFGFSQKSPEDFIAECFKRNF